MIPNLLKTLLEDKLSEEQFPSPGGANDPKPQLRIIWKGQEIQNPFPSPIGANDFKHDGTPSYVELEKGFLSPVGANNSKCVEGYADTYQVLDLFPSPVGASDSKPIDYTNNQRKGRIFVSVPWRGK